MARRARPRRRSREGESSTVTPLESPSPAGGTVARVDLGPDAPHANIRAIYETFREHGISMTIGGCCPQVIHDEALAATYPEFTRYTYPHAVSHFAVVGRILDPALAGASDEVAAERCCEAIDVLLKRIGMWPSLQGLGVSQAEVREIALHCHDLPDHKNNLRVATIDEIRDMLVAS